MSTILSNFTRDDCLRTISTILSLSTTPHSRFIDQIGSHMQINHFLLAIKKHLFDEQQEIIKEKNGYFKKKAEEEEKQRKMEKEKEIENQKAKEAEKAEKQRKLEEEKHRKFQESKKKGIKKSMEVEQANNRKSNYTKTKESKSKSKKPTLNTRKNTSIQDSKRKFRSKRKVGDQARPKKAKSFQENERKPRKKFFFDDQLFDSNNSDPAALWKVTDLFFREITDSDLSLLKTTNLQETGLMDIPPLGELYKDKWAREDEKKTTTKKKRKSKRKGATGQTDTQSEQATDENFRNDQRRFFKMINEKNAQKNIGFEIPPEFTSSHNLVHRLLSAILVEDEDTSMEFLNKFKTNGIIDFQNENSPARNHSHDRRLGVPTSPLTPDLNQDKQNIDPTHSQKLNTQNDLDSYQNLSLEKKLEFELKSVGLINEPVDLSNRKDDQVCTKIRILQSQLADIVERNNRMKTEILQKALKQQQEDQERLKKEEQHKRFLAQYEELLAKNPSKKRSARNK
ncbi:transcriptional adapter 3-related [Anaeramoeba ignava]|uniref:Transcriptional adapter 3-related n=1 Tax=Anaeramoeba ignava TaxID=1746090 RepID=A0A9Q0LTH4_ANAIG|nr:transcriptional adapter 3-related [Anaeramoeba ignava]